jgi:hypothetical protein
MLRMSAVTAAVCVFVGCGSGAKGPSAIGGSSVSCMVGINSESVQGMSSSCVSCTLSHCGSVIDDAYGSDPNTFGGVCASYSTCLCNTTDLNGECERNESVDCIDESSMVDDCLLQYCAQPCANHI